MYFKNNSGRMVRTFSRPVWKRRQLDPYCHESLSVYRVVMRHYLWCNSARIEKIIRPGPARIVRTTRHIIKDLLVRLKTTTRPVLVRKFIFWPCCNGHYLQCNSAHIEKTTRSVLIGPFGPYYHESLSDNTTYCVVFSEAFLQGNTVRILRPPYARTVRN